MSAHRTRKIDRFWYMLLRPAAKAVSRWLFAYEKHIVRPKAPVNLIYCNHQTILDAAMVATDFPGHMYFVCSEHVPRRKGGWLLMLFFNPILRMKARRETEAALNILRALRQGYSVCVFMEGECTYDGDPMPIPQTASHLAQMAGCSLLTYRLHGGYFTQPRWGRGLRRGRMYGELAGEYSPEQLQAMSREEIQARIEADISVYSQQEQAERPVAYIGKTPAECLETVLFLCPVCGEVGQLHSQGRRFYCQCGLTLIYDEYGHFQAPQGPPPFATVKDWLHWQKEQMPALAASGRQPLLTDAGQIVFQRDTQQHYTADLAFYKDKITLTRPDGQVREFPLEEIADINCSERTLVNFLYQGCYYEIQTPYPRSGLKYQMMFRALKQQL